MAKYPAVITTMAGTNTIAEANASKQALIFTKIVIGAGDMPASIPRATALTDKRLELAITKSVKTGDGQFMVQGLLSNKNLEAGFYAREIGLTAKAGENGQEVLFSYTNGGNYVDYIPDKNTPMDSYTFTITTVVGNAEKVQAIVSDNGVASVHDLEAHNSDEHAHDNRFKAIIEKVNNMITPTDDGGRQNLAPTLALVKELIKNHNDDINTHENLFPKIKQMIIDMMTWKNVPGLTKPGHLFAANTIKEIPLPTGWRRLKVCVAWDGNTTDFNKFTQNMFPRLLEPNSGNNREFDAMQVKLSNNKQFSVTDEDGFGYTISENKLVITNAGKDSNDYIVAMYYM